MRLASARPRADPRVGRHGLSRAALHTAAVAYVTILAGTLAAVAAEPTGAVRIVGGPDGNAEALVTGPAGLSRIVGFGFDTRERVWATLQDIDGDGDLDVLVGNTVPAGVGDARTVFVIPTPTGGLPAILDIAEGAAPTSRSKAGDNDNFGYGLGTGPPPCEFYDNREPEDLGVFDFELESGDEVDQWTHTFNVLGKPTGVRLATWEIFSESRSSTIDLDGHTFNFATAPFAVCDEYPEGGLRRVFFLTGADAQIAADGAITVTFSENGDDISLDQSRLTVMFA
ncbi:hypothetical protein BH20ACT24_BH20ACT24_10250 [soil metagenome]